MPDGIYSENRIEYELTFADYKAAQWLFLKKRPWKMTIFVIFQCLLPGGGLLLLCCAGLIYFLQHSFAAVLPFLRGVAPLLAYALFLPIWRQWQLRRCYSNLFPKHAPKRAGLSWNETELISDVPGISEGRIKWAGLEGFVEDQRVALIFLRKNRFIFVPKRVLAEDQWQDLRRRFAVLGA